jgi:hypothetical protein
MKKALLIGINYLNNPKDRLNGCINDTVNMQNLLVSQFGYSEGNITVLRDDSPKLSQQPTRANILNELNKLVNSSPNCTEIWVLFSGHGTQMKDKSHDETDGLDECIVPVDYLSSGFILDDELNVIIQKIACRAILMFDSCRSGTVCDLPWVYEYKSPTAYTRRGENNQKNLNQQIYMFSGCKDTQTSADAYNRTYNQFSGAFTTAFIDSMKMVTGSIGLLVLYRNICISLKQNNFTQVPSLSCSSSVPSMTLTKVIVPSLLNTRTKFMTSIIGQTATNVTETKEIIPEYKPLNISILKMNVIPKNIKVLHM